MSAGIYAVSIVLSGNLTQHILLLHRSVESSVSIATSVSEILASVRSEDWALEPCWHGHSSWLVYTVPPRLVLLAGSPFLAVYL